MSTSRLASSICKVLGHDWGFPKCDRCGKVEVLFVSVNGLYLTSGQDYSVVEGELTFTQPPLPGSHINVAFGNDGAMMGGQVFKWDGGAIKLWT